MQFLLERWLKSSQSFIIGRALYNQIGDDYNIKTLLLGGENSINKSILKKCIASLLKKYECNNEDFSFNIKSTRNQTLLNKTNEEWQPVFVRMNYLRAKLDHYGTDNVPECIASRESLAFEILYLEDKCEAIWAKRDYYLKHGTFPEVDEEDFVIPKDPKELAKLLQNIPRNIRRNRLKMQQPGAKALYAHLYNRYKDLYKQITGNEYVEKD